MQLHGCAVVTCMADTSSPFGLFALLRPLRLPHALTLTRDLPGSQLRYTYCTASLNSLPASCTALRNWRYRTSSDESSFQLGQGRGGAVTCKGGHTCASRMPPSHLQHAAASASAASASADDALPPRPPALPACDVLPCTATVLTVTLTLCHSLGVEATHSRGQGGGVHVLGRLTTVPLVHAIINRIHRLNEGLGAGAGRGAGAGL